MRLLSVLFFIKLNNDGIISGLGPRVLVLESRHFYLNPSKMIGKANNCGPKWASKADRSMALVDDFGTFLFKFVSFLTNLSTIWWICIRFKNFIRELFSRISGFVQLFGPFAIATVGNEHQEPAGGTLGPKGLWARMHFCALFGFWCHFFKNRRFCGEFFI